MQLNTNSYIVDREHWPAYDTPQYDGGIEVAIALLAACGHGPEDLDNAGDTVSDMLQTQLMDVLFRSDELMGMMEKLTDIISTSKAATARAIREGRYDS